MQKTRPILRWPGGKARHLKTLLPLITPHTCYVETFAGGLALLLAKPPSKVEVINDANRDLIGLYRCAQFHPAALCAEVSWLLGSRVNVADFRKESGLTDLQRAARFVVRNRSSFAGRGESYGFSKQSAVFDQELLLRLIAELSKRLQRVNVECVDWERCVQLYDAPDTFFFFDPPYLHAPTGVYDGWSEGQMERLAAMLPTLHGRWLLTVDGSPFCQALFAQWHCQKVTTRAGVANSRTQVGSTFSELIITPSAP